MNWNAPGFNICSLAVAKNKKHTIVNEVIERIDYGNEIAECVSTNGYTINKKNYQKFAHENKR